MSHDLMLFSINTSSLSIKEVALSYLSTVDNILFHVQLTNWYQLQSVVNYIIKNCDFFSEVLSVWSIDS